MRGRLCAIVLVVAVGGACASAPRTRSFQEIPKYLDQGSTVTLTEVTGLTTTGRLQTLSPTSLTILAGGTPRDVPESHVAKIQRPERWIGRGALIGLGAGIGVGLIAGRSGEPSGSPFVDTQGGALDMAAGMVLGTAVGALIGAVVKMNRTVYVAPIPPTARSQGRSSADLSRQSTRARAWSDGHRASGHAAQPAAAPDGR